MFSSSTNIPNPFKDDLYYNRVYKELGSDLAVPLNKMLGYAIMAYERNNNSYIKSVTATDAWGGFRYQINQLLKHNSTEEEINDFVNNNMPANSNRDVMLEFVVERVEIPKRIVNEVDKLKKHYAGLVMKIIGGQINSFEEKVAQLLQKENIQLKDLSIIASLPATFYRESQKNQVREIEELLASVSEFVGETKTRDTFNLLVFNKFKLKKFDNLAIYACVDAKGNAVKFFKECEFCEPGTRFIVTAFIKSHDFNKFNNIRETIINRLKIVD